MAQGYKNVAIIGAGASGCITAYFLLKMGIDVTLFDYSTPLRTLLPTGGGRCNLAHAEYDFKELAKNYPRGEKFLYSVFSRFSTYDTIALFEELGVKTYTQDDGRIFPISNSAKDVRNKILNHLKNVKFIKENVIEIKNKNSEYLVKTNHAEYLFTDIVVSIGGKGHINGLEKHSIIEQKPSLVGLNSNNIKDLSGIVLKNAFAKDLELSGDILFTHFGLSGPLIYKISSINAKKAFPYNLTIDFYKNGIPLQKLLDSNPHKEFKNILCTYFPIKFVKYILKDFAEIKAHNVNAQTRDLVLEKIHNFEFQITGVNKGEETVTCGGYNLNEIDSKTMQSKLYPHIYFTGETVDIDGFCGGFNLQNAWSTAFVVADAIVNSN